MIFTAQILVLIKGGGAKSWEGEGGAGLFDNVINGVCLPGNGGSGGGHSLADVHAIIWAHGGGGKDVGRDEWAVTQQAWGSGTAGCANEGMAGMLMEGWGLGTGHLGRQLGACGWPGFGGDPPASGPGPTSETGQAGRETQCFSRPGGTQT